MLGNIPRIMITGSNSGSGKTTITCGILKALINKKISTAAFKSGPDYIDPMFHSKVVGANSRNLDLFMLGKETVKYLLFKNACKTDIAVLEGAMGFYDGLGKTSKGSAYELATVTKTPVILVVNGKGASLSIAALIKGFKEFRSDSNIQGVILNNVKPMSYMFYKEVIEQETGIKLLGYMPNMDDCGFESRHLGLITAEEVKDLQYIVDRLAAQATESIDLETILKLAQTAPALEYEQQDIEPIAKIKIAIARDKAFCFYYQDALDLLAELGAEFLPFSPLTDKKLPQCDGIILGGGYPEIYAAELAENKPMLKEIKNALAVQMPCFAECGGFMYLLETYKENNQIYKWVGAIQGETFMTKSLKHFGYITLEAQKNNVLTKAGGKINAHEFHYSDSSANGDGFLACKASGRGQWPSSHVTDTMYAGYPHMHLWGNVDFARSFVQACAGYKKKLCEQGDKKC
ncbi:MAG: cobyrinate a,c-diamide synthase [Acidaminococcaceae bacterium]|nr:cobyrinate a,c-diamide synthase [Acidaminococcaceae bacterium]